ncbi:histidinol dehydrogenase, partial [Candidatus Saccharibacteria bacterium]|nr:histidinol dehydrogenase [Candidatus Saccharibacteria bacterium]NIW80396.1 histidinol dehydrogenase [Calditrichia bacterium]
GLEEIVQPILKKVKENGDAAVKEYTQLLDQVDLTSIRLNPDQVSQANRAITDELKRAIESARKNITTFHQSQKIPVKKVETSRGVFCWQKPLPIERVGLYVPGGTAPLFSTVLMLGIPAIIAGCSKIILCTPPDKQGNIHPAIIYTASLLGITKIYRVGGAQAVAAMAYGTETIPKVDKILGPGNQYVTAAKQLVSREGVAIDMPAGPSEVAVIADETAHSEFVTADLLSQAEHGADSQVILVTTQAELLSEVQNEMKKQLSKLPRKEMVKAALTHSKFILTASLEQGMELINFYAPEHLILMVKNPEDWAEKVVNAGSVFLGEYTPEAAGDYASGTNHTLPTNGYARAYSGVSLDSFVKKITFQQISRSGLRQIGPAIEQMAVAEMLEAHKNAVQIRLKT